MYDRAWLHEFAQTTRWFTERAFRTNSCILSTRIGLGVLERFGVKARPQAVQVHAYNTEGWQMSHQKVPLDQWPDSAWAVGVEGTGKVDPETRGWDGHLVIVVRNPSRKRTLIDLTADQFDRPQRGIHVPGPIFMDLTEIWTPEDPLYTEDDGTIVSYQPQARAGDWRETPDWVADSTPFVDAICKELSPLTQGAPA